MALNLLWDLTAESATTAARQLTRTATSTDLALPGFRRRPVWVISSPAGYTQ